MSDFLLPDSNAVTEMLAMLYGDDLKVSATSGVKGLAACPSALFVGDGGEPVAACVCDFAFGAYAGAALSRIPAGTANDAAKTGDLTEGMMDNLREIMNICSRLFMSDRTPHLKLEGVYSSMGDLPQNAQGVISEDLERADFGLDHRIGHFRPLQTCSQEEKPNKCHHIK